MEPFYMGKWTEACGPLAPKSLSRTPHLGPYTQAPPVKPFERLTVGGSLQGKQQEHLHFYAP